MVRLKNKRKTNKTTDMEHALHVVGREEQFERNGGGQWVSMNRPHKNKKKYDRKQKKREDRGLSFFYISFRVISYASKVLFNGNKVVNLTKSFSS